MQKRCHDGLKRALLTRGREQRPPVTRDLVIVVVDDVGYSEIDITSNLNVIVLRYISQFGCTYIAEDLRQTRRSRHHRFQGVQRLGWHGVRGPE